MSTSPAALFASWLVIAGYGLASANVTAQSRLAQIVLEATWTRFQLDSEQPALVQAAANLVIDFRDRGNTAGCISSVADLANRRDHMDVLNSFARRLNPIITMRIVDIKQASRETYKTQLVILVVDGLDGFK